MPITQIVEAGLDKRSFWLRDRDRLFPWAMATSSTREAVTTCSTVELDRARCPVEQETKSAAWTIRAISSAENRIREVTRQA